MMKIDTLEAKQRPPDGHKVCNLTRTVSEVRMMNMATLEAAMRPRKPSFLVTFIVQNILEK